MPALSSRERLLIPLLQIFRKPQVTMSVIDPSGQTYVTPQNPLANTGRMINLRISRFRPNFECRVVIDVVDEYNRPWSAVSSPFFLSASHVNS